MNYIAPDPQTLLLNALIREHERACKMLELGPYQIGSLQPEPHDSIVFDGSFFAERAETWDDDDDAAIRLVMERDVQKQIESWRQALDRLAAGDFMPEDEARSHCEAMAERDAEMRAGC